MAGLFTKAATDPRIARTGMTTMALARDLGVRATFSAPKINESVNSLLADKMQRLSLSLSSGLQGVQDPAERQKVLKDLAAKENALPDKSLRLLDSSEYFALMSTTPHPEAHRGNSWNREQVLIHDETELSQMIEIGANFLHANTVDRKLSTVVTAMPSAGMAARAGAELLARPDLLGTLQLLKAMEGLPEGFPPRFMYPVRTRLSPKEIKTMTLLSLMLQSSREISKETGAMIGSILMLHPNMTDYVLGKIEQDLVGLSQEELESISLFPQKLSAKYQVGVGQYTDPTFPAGHGDFPSTMAQAQMFNLLAEQGVQMMFYSNADEIVYAPNPVLVAASKKLIDDGYSAVVFVVANTNGQKGGGPFKHVNSDGNVLQEAPTLPKNVNDEISRREIKWKAMLEDQKDKDKRKAADPLPPINTLSLALSIPALAAVSDQFTTVTPGLDVKPYEKKDHVLGLESWSGTEFTSPAARTPDNFRVAFVFVERTGFFTGIKMPLHVYGNFQDEQASIPPELWNLPASSPFAPFSNYTYFQYIRYLAEKYPVIIRGMFDQNQALISRLFKAGGGYLVEV